MATYATTRQVTTATGPYIVTIRPINPSTWQKVGEFFYSLVHGFHYFERRHNDASLARHGELIAPFSDAFAESKILFSFRSRALGEVYVTGFPPLGAALQNIAKHGEVFQISDTSSPFFDFVSKIVENATPEDAIYFSQNHSGTPLHTALLKALKANQQEKNHKIKETVEDFFGSLQDYEEVELFPLFQKFTTALAFIGLGVEKSGDACNLVGEALFTLHRVATQKSIGLPLSDEDKENYESSIVILKKTLDDMYNQRIPFVSAMQKAGMAEPQIKSSMLALLEGGTQGPTYFLMFAIWELGQRESPPEDISQFVNECLREYPTAYILPRQFKEQIDGSATEVLVADQKGQVIFNQTFYPNEKIFYSPYLAGRYYRPTEEEEDSLWWYPFGTGAHPCPGKALAMQGFKALTGFLIENYQIQSFPESITPIGRDQLQPKEKVMATFTKIQ